MPRDELYLVQGEAGTGKTTLALQFLLAGVSAGERVLYITLSQTRAGLGKIARSHGWSLEDVPIFDVLAVAAGAASQQTLFHPADVELVETMGAVVETIKRTDPQRLVFDSAEELRLLVASPLGYQRQLLALRRFLAECSCTTLFTASETGNKELQNLMHGVIDLEQMSPEYGNVRRRLRVVKMRGSAHHGGYHDFKIHTGELEVYPRLEANGAGGYDGWETFESGVEGIDALLGGGLERGTSCLIVGPTGTGKTTLASLYAFTAVKRGERAAIFLFDERVETFLRRSEGLGMDFRPYLEGGLVSIQQISTGELSPGEFGQTVRQAEEDGAKVVVIDSLSGYVNAMPQESQLLPQMHELLIYLSQRGVLSLLIMSQHGIVGNGLIGSVDISYMVDSVVLLRHFEALGTLRKALSVVKKRHGTHENTIRELRLKPDGIEISEPLTEFSGVLTGTPTFRGDARALLDHHANHHAEDDRS